LTRGEFMMQRMAQLGGVLLLAAAPAFAQVMQPPAFAEWTLGPGAFEELCFELDAGGSVRYAFDADAPLDFNAHWHRGKDVFFPIKSAAVERRAGVFRAPAKEAYCLMWTNRQRRPVVLRARIDAAP
jgi:hypothetical protein